MFRQPFVPTMEAQYILKNVVLVSAALVIGVEYHEKKKSGAEKPFPPVADAPGAPSEHPPHVARTNRWPHSGR
jgi:hypothetical protein